MADINSGTSGEHAVPPASAGAREDDVSLVTLVELLFLAYRDFTGEADEVLARFGFGRAHHRVLHFVNRRPGMRVADLLDILRITKQSLARVLKELVDRGFIAQEAGVEDRRERRLHPTAKGRLLAEELVALQSKRIAGALATAGPSAEHIVRAFLEGMVGTDTGGEPGGRLDDGELERRLNAPSGER